MPARGTRRHGGRVRSVLGQDALPVRSGAIVYQPTHSGLLSGTFSAERAASLPVNGWRGRSPDFTTDLERDLRAARALEPATERHGVSAASVAIASSRAVPEGDTDRPRRAARPAGPFAGPDDPARMVLMEEWTDPGAPEAPVATPHSPHVARVLDRVLPEPRSVRRLVRYSPI